MGPELQTVVVTATRREEDIKDIPTSVTALDSATLAEHHVVDYDDLTRSVPGLSFQAGAGPGLDNIAIRGVSSTSGSATVGIYVDDVSVTVKNTFDGSVQPKLFDLERIEVLRGPQGTLFGASSMGGTIRFITNKPDLDHSSIAGSTDVAGLYRSFLWHDGIRAVLAAAGPLVSGWRHVVETLGHGSSNGVGVGRGAEVLAVAVDPAWQGRGVGRLLLVSLLDEFRSRGGDAAHVVVGADNDAAIALYERVGFVAQEHFELHVGTESLLMQWEHRSDPAGADAGPQ